MPKNQSKAAKADQKARQLEILRHSTAHVLAAAVLEMFPEAKFAIGPAIENGFYYDFELPRTLIPEDLPLLEEKMKALIQTNHSFEKKMVPIAEAKKDFEKLGQKYKVELLKELEKEGEKQVMLYKTGSFVDLCKGPHQESTGEIKADAFKLTSISGAYWHGDEKREQLQRIYGVAFQSKKELKQYLAMMEEAEKRDHRKLGKELDLFCFSALVGPGLPLFTPKGVILREELQKHIEKVCRRYGFEKVSAPSLARPKMYEISGHAMKFGDENFKVTSPKGHEFAMKPVQCPHHTQIYASKKRSYRDLPIRYMESDKQYRAEKPGEIGGLNRVYAITVEDGHIFCRIEQIKDEIKNLVKIAKEFYQVLNLWDKKWVRLSIRDPKELDKYIGNEKDWKECERMLSEISDEMDLKAKTGEGEAAVYGPKLDFISKDAMGRDVQIATIQLDFASPKRFKLSYTDQKGEELPPVMIHRAILGSYERFLALIIEHYAGNFPLWLAPLQVAILPVSEKFDDYAKDLFRQLKAEDLRVELHNQDESLGKRIALAKQQKIPYLLVVGEKEVGDKAVSVNQRGTKKQEALKFSEFLGRIKQEITDKIIF